MSLRKHMKFRPKTVDGKYAPGEVTVPIRFAIPPMLSAEATSVALTPGQEALARRLIAALGLEADMAVALNEGLQQSLYYTAVFDAEERRIISESIRAALSDLRPKFFEALAADLVTTFPDAELERVTLFFETPGRAEGRAPPAGAP